MSIRAVIVEDEPHARESLREYARELSWLSIVGEAENGRDAVRMIDSLQPDLVFLDVSLPEASGLDVLERISHRPDVVFTTAHDDHAIAAFELGALDYLLKPFGSERFAAAMARVRKRLSSGETVTERARVASGVPLKRIFARTRDAIVPIDVSSIQHISASGDYSEIHTSTGSHLLHARLTDLAARLDPATFQQVHRSHIVNLDQIEKLVPFDSRRLLIRLRGGAEILASRSASENLRRLID
jgi:two-component system LytT family response regulator